MKKIISLLETILLLTAVGLATSAATNVSVKPISAMAQTKQEKAPHADAVAASLDELKSGPSNRFDDEEAIVAELTIHERLVGNVVILDLEGKIADGGGTAALRHTIGGLLDEGKKNILLNLKGVSSVDDGGLDEIVASYNAVQAKNGKLKLLNLPAYFNDNLHITQFITVFEVYDNEDEAVASF